jgi:hypothetical protein
MSQPTRTFALEDRVRILQTGETIRRNIAGLVGRVIGFDKVQGEDLVLLDVPDRLHHVKVNTKAIIPEEK